MNQQKDTTLSPEVRERVTERYYKEYCADEAEEREVRKILETMPLWFEWWMDVLSQELSKKDEEWREKIRKAKRKAKCRIGKGDPGNAHIAGTRLGIFQADQRAQKEFDALLSKEGGTNEQ